jgi:hypothetical protein
MSFLPKLGPEEFEDLFKLFTAAIYQVGISPKEARGLKILTIAATDFNARKNQRMLKMTKVTEVEKVTREATIRPRPQIIPPNRWTRSEQSEPESLR